MRKKFLAAALILALAVALCPAALAAGKLSTPTDLQWDVKRYHDDPDSSSPHPGAMSWNFGENTNSMVRFAVYRNGKKLAEQEFGYFEEMSGLYSSEPLNRFLCTTGNSLDNGSYYFTVQNITDWDSTSANNSAVAKSETWTYTKPSAKLTSPAAPVWSFPYCTWQANQDSDKSEFAVVELYYSETKNGAFDLLGGDLSYTPGRLAFPEWHSGIGGYYKFRVMNLSDDISQWQDSDWSPFSEPYYYDGSPVEICHHYNQTFRNETWATCTEDGYTGDYICLDCGEIMEKGEVIPALGHVVDPYDGSCMRCGQQLEYYGTLGKSGQLAWTYSIEEGTVSFDGDIPSLETVLVACYNDSGRFTGVKLIDRWSMETQVGTNFATMKLFWLDAKKAPKCQAVEVTPAF